MQVRRRENICLENAHSAIGHTIECVNIPSFVIFISTVVELDKKTGSAALDLPANFLHVRFAPGSTCLQDSIYFATAFFLLCDLLDRVSQN